MSKHPTWIGVAAWLIACGLAVGVRAQDAAQPAGISTTQDGVETIEVHGEQPDAPEFLDTPLEVEMIPEQRLRELPARDLADVAANLPGIRVQRRVQGQGSAASVEGLPPEYTRALVNGQHYAGELGGVTDLEDLPLANASRVLVLRGPQAMRYGSEAGGAVIEIETFRPPAEDGLRFALDSGLGSYDAGYASQVTGGRVGRFGATLTTTYNTIDGWNDNGSDALVGGPGRDYREQWQDAYSTFEFQATPDFLLSSNVGWRKDKEESEGLLLREDGSISGPRTTTRWITSLGFAAQLGENTELESEVYRFASNMKSAIGRDFQLQDEEWRYDGALTQRFQVFGQEPSLRVGLDWRLPSLDLKEQQVATEGLPPPPTRPDDPSGPEYTTERLDERFTVAGIYAILEAPVHETVTFQLGAREQFHSRFDSEFVPQLALLVEPLSWLKLRASWGKSYRTPSLRDLYEPPVPNLGGAYFLAGNPNLKPEHAEGLRGGVELAPTDELWLSATLFTNQIKDYIRSAKAPEQYFVGWGWSTPDDSYCQEFPDDPACAPAAIPQFANLFQRTNLDEVKTSGAEANLRYQPHPMVSLHVGYTWLNTWVKSAPLPDLHELPNEPEHTVDLDATFTLPRWDTGLLVRARWRNGALMEASGTGSASFASLDRSHPSWVVGLRLRQPIRAGLSLYLDLDNVTNTKAVDSYEIRGFNAFVGVRYQFDSH
ncbi:MAG: TonB-dependent receptor [Myxococcota bacterium]